MVIKFVKQWWFLISAFAILSASVAAWGVRIDTQIRMSDKYVPRSEIMLRFDHVDHRQSEMNVKLELIMDELGVEDVPLQHPIASQP